MISLTNQNQHFPTTMKDKFSHFSSKDFYCVSLSIGDWVLYKRGVDGDNSYLKFLSNFRKRKKKSFFQLRFLCNFLVRTLRYIWKKKFFCPPKHKKNSPQKLLIVPQDHQFSVQQVFALWNCDILKSEIFSSLKLSNFAGWNNSLE